MLHQEKDIKVLKNYELNAHKGKAQVEVVRSHKSFLADLI